MSTAIAGVVAFVTLLGSATFSEPDFIRNDGARISIGQSQGYITESILSAGIEHSKWEANYTVQGNRSEGTADGNTRMYSLTRNIRPDWGPPPVQPVFKIGPAYVTNSPFVGRENMHLGFGVEMYGKFHVGWNHYSSGGVQKPNRGLDDVRITYLIEW